MITSKLLIAFPYLLGSLIICIGLAISIWRLGKPASLSTLFHNLISLESTEMTWKGAVLCGLVFGGTLLWNIFGYGPVFGTTFQFYEHEDTFLKGTNVYGFLLSGFLVGLGTSLANGGLTGHIFCGIPRLSLKSIIATVIFMVVAFVTCTFKNRASFLSGARASVISIYVWPRVTTLVPMALCLAILLFKLYYLYRNSLSGNEELSFTQMYQKFLNNRAIVDMIVSFGVGIILACGLLVSGLSDRKKMLSFLSVDDPYYSLAYALVGGIIGNVILLRCFGSSLHTYEKTNTGFFELILGSALFGAGLGLCGLTIGTAVMVAPLYFPEVYLWFIVPACFGNIAAPYISEFIQGSSNFFKEIGSKEQELEYTEAI